MIEWYFKTNEMLRKICEMNRLLLSDLKTAKEEELKNNNYFQKERNAIKEYAYEFKHHWEKVLYNEKIPSRLLNHVGFGADEKWGKQYHFDDYSDIIMIDLPMISKKADEIFKTFCRTLKNKNL